MLDNLKIGEKVNSKEFIFENKDIKEILLKGDIRR